MLTDRYNMLFLCILFSNIFVWFIKFYKIYVKLCWLSTGVDYTGLNLCEKDLTPVH